MTSTSRFTGIRPLALDDDERPSSEDLAYGETIFTRGLFHPRWLRRRRRS